MKQIGLVAGGPQENLAELKTYHQKNMIWVGIDRGVRYLAESGLPIFCAFGDFDSITKDEYNHLTNTLSHLSSLSSEKDQTDTEVALEWAIEQEPDHIYIFGATGGRMDHMLGNLHLLIKSTFILSKIEIIDRQNQITLFTPGTYIVKRKHDWKYTSFIAVTPEVEGLTLEGFKYPLKNSHIRLGSTLCISNELIHEVGTFSFLNGILLMIRSRD